MSKFLLNSAKTWQAITSVLVVLIGCAVLLGWIFQIPVLKSLLPDSTTMKANTALGFILVGAALWFLRNQPIAPRHRHLAQICAAVVFAIGLLTLTEYIFGWNLGIDQLLFRDTGSSAGTLFPGRMAEASALSLLLMGLTLWLLSEERRLTVAQILALIVIGIGLFAFTGYLYASASLYGFFVFAAVSLPTSIALLIAGISILLIRPHRGWMAVISGDHSGSVMARRLLPSVLIVPLVAGGLAFAGERYGLYGGEVEIALFTLATIMFFAPLIWWSAYLLNNADAQRKQAETGLKRYAQRMEILHEIDKGIIEGKSIQALVEATLERLRQVIPCQNANVALIDPVTSEGIVFAVDVNGITALQEGMRMPLAPDFLQGYDASYRQVIEDIRQMPESSPIARQLASEGMLSGLKVLLMEKERPIGVLNLRADTASFFSAEYQEIATEIANQIAISIEQMHLREAVEQHTALLEQRIVERTAELQAAKDRAEAILDNSVDGILLVNPNLQIQQVNPAFNRLFACTSDDYFQQSLTLLAQADDAEMVTSAVLGVEKDGQERTLEFHASRKDNTLFDAELSIGIVRNSGFVCSLRDISERKRAQEALAASERRFRLMVSGVRDYAIYMLDPEGNVASWNSGAEHIKGYTAAEVIGRNFALFYTPESIAQGEPQHVLEIARSEGQYRGEGWRVRKDGSRLWAEVLVTSVRDNQNQLIGFSKVTRDLTERRRVEEALRKSEVKFRQLVDAAPIATVISDQAGLITLINGQAELLFGYHRGELVGQPVELLVPEYLREQHVHHRADYVTAPRVRQMGIGLELFARRKDGSEFPTEIELSYVESDAGLLVMVFVVDVTERKQRERQLRFSASLQENVNDAVISTDLDLTIQTWNPAAEQIYGWRAEEVIGQNSAKVLQTEFTSGDSGERILNNFRENGFWTAEVIQHHKDGHAIHILGSITLIKDDLDAALGIVAVNHDITERTRVEKALHESESLYRLLANSINDVVIRFLPTFEYLYVSPSSRAVLGYKPEELLGPSDFQRIHPEDLPAIRALIESLMEHPGAASITYRFRHKEGHYVWMEGSGQTVVSEQTGAVVEFVFSLRDVTDRKAAEEALRESEAGFRSFFEQPLIGMAVTSPLKEVIKVNDKLCEMFGYSQDEMRHLVWSEITHPDDLAAELAQFDRVLAGEIDGYSLDKRFVRKDGQFIDTIMNTRCLRDSQGKVMYFIALVQDISERKQTEEAVRASEARYRLLADNMTDMVTRVDTSGTAVYVSPSSRTLLGYAPEELVGKSSYEQIHPDDIGELIRQQSDALEPNVAMSPPIYRVRHKDGHYVWVETSGQVIWSADKTDVLGFITISRDITERKKVEEAVRESEARYRLLADNISDMVTRIDGSGISVYVSPSSRTLLGYEPEELVGKSGFELVHPDDLNEAISKQREAIESAAQQPPLIYRVRHKDGRYLWVETAGQVIWSADKTDVLGFITISRDITERKKGEEALREQRDFLQLVIDNVPGLIMVKDSEGHFQLVNNRIAEVYGITPADMIGKTDGDLNPNQNEVVFFSEKDRETLDSGQAVFIPEEPLLDRYYQTNKIPLKRPDGTHDRLLVVAADITERKKAEEALRRAFDQEKELGELKSRFVSMASHEFRTPLATILAAAETLSAYRQKMTEDQIDHRVNNIRDQVDHLKNIIEDVLQLARIQAGRMDFTPVVFDLDGLCRSVIDEFESHPDVTHQLVYSCVDELKEVKLDKKLTRQIINNLVSNAIKYSPDANKVFISLELVNNNVVLSVRDEGIGIPEADLKHLFEPFHRAANVGTISGTGLGLSITKEAVELHGGTIHVESQVGDGTRVTAIIPISKQIGQGDEENPGH